MQTMLDFYRIQLTFIEHYLKLRNVGVENEANLNVLETAFKLYGLIFAVVHGTLMMRSVNGQLRKVRD